jgi:ankyrin repeat protein
MHCRSTLLHTAARHNRSDCVQQLLSKGVDVTALDSKDRSALQLACLYCDSDTVTLLFDTGGWVDNLATACMLNATISGHLNTLMLLIERGISCSNVIDNADGYTLLHAAATYGRLECAGLLLRNGYDATILSNDGASAVDIAFELEVPAVFEREDIAIESWESCKATASLLLQHGCEYDANKVFNIKAYAAVIAQYLDELRERTTKQQEILQVYTANTYSIYTAAAISEHSSQAADDTTLRIQLVHADSGVISSNIYTIDTALLSKLHAATARQSTSILLNMLVPTYGWGISNVNSSADTRLISYDGK